MRPFVNGFLVLSVCVAPAFAAPLYTGASVDINLWYFEQHYEFHSAQEGTSSAQAGHSIDAGTGAGGSASITGTMLRAVADSAYSHSWGYDGLAQSSAQVILTDMLLIDAPYDRMEVDLAFGRSSAAGSAESSIQVRTDNTYFGWSSGRGSYPATPEPITIPSLGSLQMWLSANAKADGVGNVGAWAEVTIQSIRVYDSSGSQMSGFTYRDISGLAYPVQGGTLANIPEPGTLALLIAGGLLAGIGRKFGLIRTHW